MNYYSIFKNMTNKVTF